MTVSNLGTPINSSLQFQPGGNPIAGLASGGLAGLGQAYGQDYNSYLSASQQNYNNITGGYQTLMNNIGQTLGQGGTDWGIAQPAANQIVASGNAAAGGAIQNSINSGVGKSTAAVAAQRGVTSDTQQALGQLGSSLASTMAGYQSGIGQGLLGMMNSVSITPPNGAAYNQLAQQYGQQQQGAANLALQQQALQYQMQSSRVAAGRSAAGGGGGVSIPNAPRGGTFGSGGGGFPSGGATTPTSGGFGNTSNTTGPVTVTPNAGQQGTNALPGQGGSGVWNPFTEQDEDPYQGIGGTDPWATPTGTASGDPTGVTGNFGNTGYYLGSGVA